MTQIIDESSFNELLKAHPKFKEFLNEEDLPVIDGKYVSLAKLIDMIEFTIQIKDPLKNTSNIKFTQDSFISGNGLDFFICSKVDIPSEESVTITNFVCTDNSIEVIKYIYISALLHRFGIEQLNLNNLDLFYEKLKYRIFTTDMPGGNKILISNTEDFIERYNNGDRIEEYTHITIIPRKLLHEKSENPSIIHFAFEADFIAPENHGQGICRKPN